MVMNNHARYFPWRLPKISHKQVELVGNEKSIDDHKKMKRYDNIFDKIIDIKNIEKAIEKASKRKRNRKSVKKILENKELCAELISNILKNNSYIPSPYAIQTIYDGTRHKERTIYKPRFFPDQIIHWAVMLQIGDILKKRFYYYSCASIKGKGTGLGIKATKKIMKTKYRYCLKMDIEKFYPNVDKEILKQKFIRVFKDERLLSLLDTVIDGNETQGTGIPIGNYCSQWFANFYLNDLDNFIKHELKIKHYIRYMDDIVVFHTNKRKLRKTKDSIEEYLAKEHLKIKPNWQLFDLNKRFLDFLGFRFYKTHTTIRRNNFLRPKRRAKKIYRKGYISLKDASAMISYNGLIKNSNCHGYLTKYINPYVSINRCKKVVSKNAKGEKNEINKQ